MPLPRVDSNPPGLRGAIGLLLLAALVAFAFPAQGKLLQSWMPRADGTLLYVLGHFAELAEILIFAAVAARFESRSFADYGLPWRQTLRTRFWQGAALGIGSLAVLVLTLSGIGALKLALPGHLGLGALLAGPGYLLLFILLGLREEFLYRGYGLSSLARMTGFWPAALASSAWFVLTHVPNSGETPLGLAAVGAFGILACILLRRTGNLWLPIGFHAAWDWGETFLFGVANSGHTPPPGHFFSAITSASAPVWLSGAAAGPEGSVLCLALISLLILKFAGWRPP